MNINDFIDKNAQVSMKNAIKESGGNEVFFRGIPDENGLVTEVVVLARGNKHSVPAILNGVKKKEVVIHNHPSGYLYPSDPDVAIASAYANEKYGASYIINNEASEIYVIAELGAHELKPIDIIPYFEEKGMLSQAFPEFEYRHEQLEMASTIQEGLNKSEKVIVEAGTGTGKTLGYLIPAIEWALTNEKKVIVTTNTINLQEQLLSKDLPIAKKVIGKEFTYTLVKGRSNYLCNRKLTNINSGSYLEVHSFDEYEIKEFKNVLKWSKITKTGDKAELSFEVRHDIWEHFHSESDVCAAKRCPHGGECFFLKSREEKQKADLLITNHHLFFADLAIRKETGFNTDYAVLPDYDLVVFDEAHNIEQVARDYFSYEASRYSFNKAMNKFHHASKKKQSGAFDTLIRYLHNISFPEYEKLRAYIKTELLPEHKDLYRVGGEFFLATITAFDKDQRGNYTERLKKENWDRDTRNLPLKEKEDEFTRIFNSYLKKQRNLIKELKEIEDDDGVIFDFFKFIERLESFFSTLKLIRSMDESDFIYWVSTNAKKGNAKFAATPLKIASELNLNLHLHLDHIIFTSATIAIGDDFSYFKRSIGLNEKTIEKVIFSPFDYDKQMEVYLPTDLPLPNEKTFNDLAVKFLADFFKVKKGNAFLLFTSYSSLNYMYYMLKDKLEAAGHDLFIQGMAPRNKIIEMFKNGHNPILFGTDSFWEGVDVKGDKLSLVVLTKLPFKVPSDPIVEAIIENLESQGKNPFMEYQIPESIIKFKQGIGRLIRSKEDKGQVLILDTRISKKRYGKLFIEATPTNNITIKDTKSIIKTLTYKR